MFEDIREFYEGEQRGPVEVKGKGAMHTYLLQQRKTALDMASLHFHPPGTTTTTTAGAPAGGGSTPSGLPPGIHISN